MHNVFDVAVTHTTRADVGGGVVGSVCRGGRAMGYGCGSPVR